jgi:hypothetical protein
MDATRFLASLIRAKASLHSAIVQTLPTDDRIIAGHVAEAHETLRTVLEIARQDDRSAYLDAVDIACQEIGRPALAKHYAETMERFNSFVARSQADRDAQDLAHFHEQMDRSAR